MARQKKRLLIVDGYNVLNAWQGAGMRGRTGEDIAEARDRLIARLEDYAGYSGQRIIVVFDAWQSDRKTRT
ncbi:MAG: NYN domain-containing protein, partial [Aristaeellaceae bacterium]